MRRSRLEKGNIDRKIPGENKDVVTAHRSESELSESAIKSKDNNAKDEGVATAEKDEIDLLQSGETQHSSLRKAVHSDERSDDLSPNNSANQANSEDISEMQPAHRPASPLSLSEIPYAGAPSVVPPKPTSTVHNDTSDAFIREILQQLDIIKRDSDRMQNFMAILKPLISDSIDDPKKRYDHDEWESLLGTLHETDRESLNPMASDFYWLSESSPLRLPLNEPNYLTMKFVIRMELDLKNSLAVDIRNLERLIRESRSIKLLSQGNVQISRTKDHT